MPPIISVIATSTDTEKESMFIGSDDDSQISGCPRQASWDRKLLLNLEMVNPTRFPEAFPLS